MSPLSRAAWLFCPASRPDRYLKALDRADIVILDLEDAVAADGKQQARQAVGDLVESGEYAADRTVLRINAVGSPAHELDLRLVERTGIAQVMLAKTDSVEQVQSLAGLDVVALLETPRGIREADAIAEVGSVVAVMVGIDDLATSIGGTSSRRPDGEMREVARYARSRVLVAAKSAGKIAVDAVYLDIADMAGLSRDAAEAAALGFDAKPAVHPAQVEAIRDAYRPTREQVEWARRLLEAAGDGAGAMMVDGRMVDAPVYGQAERVLRRAAIADR